MKTDAQQPKKSLMVFKKYFKSYIGLIILGSVFLILSQIAITSQPIFLRNIINDLSAQNAMRGIIISLVFYFLARIIDLLFEFLRDYFLSPVVIGVPRDFEKDVFEHLLKLPVSYHSNNKTGAASRAITRGAQAISFMLDFSVAQVIPPLLQLLLVTGLLLNLYTWQYGVITFTTVVIYAIFTIWSTEKRSLLRQAGNAQDDLAGALLVDSVSNIDTVKYFNNHKNIFNQFSKIKQEWYRLRF